MVAAAGNTGFGAIQPDAAGPISAGLGVTINDPGNAQLAITVGSTHRDMPHTYGVSYFSSKGPTGDGRLKPDIVAPGEKIISCAAGRKRQETARKVEVARRDSGVGADAPESTRSGIAEGQDLGDRGRGVSSKTAERAWQHRMFQAPSRPFCRCGANSWVSPSA